MTKLFSLLFICALICGCTRTLTVEEGTGTKTITVDRDQVVEESVQVESITQGTSFESTQSCAHMGTCCKCGFTLQMKHECSCGIWRNCPGTQKVTLQPITKTFRRHYTVKFNNDPKKMKSPLYQETYNKTLAAGSCN